MLLHLTKPYPNPILTLSNPYSNPMAPKRPEDARGNPLIFTYPCLFFLHNVTRSTFFRIFAAENVDRFVMIATTRKNAKALIQRRFQYTSFHC